MNIKKILLVVFFAACIVSATLAADTGEEQPTVTLVFQEDDLIMVLSEITLQTGINIVADDSVGGAVTVDLEDVPIEYALDVILKPRDIYYKKLDGYYFVCLADPRATGFRRISETEVVKLNNIKTDELLNLIPGYYTKFLNIDAASNRVTITAPQEIINDFKKILRDIDTPKKQVKVSVVVVEIAKELIKERSPLNFSLELPQDISGIDWNGMKLEWGKDPFKISASIYDWLMLNMKVLEANNLAKMHSDPNIMLLDGETANIFVGETKTIITGETGTSNNINVGVSINVRAKIFPDFIEMYLNPDVSHFTENTSESITVYRSVASTTIRVSSGETVVIAGLTLKKEVDTLSGIPLLNKIPLLRFLFSGKNDSSSERELMIFVTPYIQGM
ncbi:hypothetical protein AT15_04690 [Kosmotoga arenicorallina S304]|uniref:Type II/III secretion system secretin-like domain-containing protein n=1 Tax=Kosmotoga arenicorallina S304 TaxID=1453497 RepID=A0A176JXH2_9BACT|nr:hypothetical protein [Kosmotoga arenicorallina]OAA28376.1 hypothetical protein AT15_04690 [Kosmotoga arenicorallina S304]